MPGRIIAHIDMDSFYASVEIRDNPDLTGKPVIIGADPAAGRGVVSTCSYEARQLGVHSGMPVSQAHRLCPRGVYIRPRMSRYLAVSRSIMGYLNDYVHEVEQVSIDEAYLDLTGTGSLKAAEEMAVRLKGLIYEREYLTSSIGIGPARSYAKIASGLDKPDGLFIFRPSDLERVIAPLPVGKIPGVGKKASQELHRRGIITIGDLAAADIQILQEIAGSSAVRLQMIARGEDTSGLKQPEHRKSISRETTYLSDTDDETKVMATLDQLASAVHHDLTGGKMFFKTITLKIRYSGFSTTNHSFSLMHPDNDLAGIVRVSRALFDQNWTGDPIRLIGVKLSELYPYDPVQTRISDFFQ